jgi:hypothetical protein
MFDHDGPEILCTRGTVSIRERRTLWIDHAVAVRAVATNRSVVTSWPDASGERASCGGNLRIDASGEIVGREASQRFESRPCRHPMTSEFAGACHVRRRPERSNIGLAGTIAADCG